MRTLSLLLLLTASAHAGPLTAGAAKIDITPPNGCPMAGYYHTRANEGTLDPLFAKALVLEKDGTRVALVVLDLIHTTPGMTAEARKQVAEMTGIPGTHLMLSATHSHTGPVLSEGNPRADAFGGENKLAVEYIRGLPAKIAEVVAAADKARQPAVVSHAVGREDGLAFNRRFHMTDGTVGWNPGKKNPKIVRPAGPTDPAVPLVVVSTTKGVPIACYVNFAMHLDTVGGLKYSADYPYTLSKCLAAAKGDDLITLFTIGTAGDINHINVNSASPQKGTAEAARIGTRLAAAVLRAWDDLVPVADGPLRAGGETVPLPLAEVPTADTETAAEVIAKVRSEAKPAPPFMDQVKAFRAADVAARLGKPVAAEVQVISLGDDLAWAALPGEVFVELGLTIKAGSPFKNTIPVELANGSIGYIPNRVAYPQGNYEVHSARCGVGSGEKLADVTLNHLRSQYGK